MSSDPGRLASSTQPYAGPANLHDKPTLSGAPPTVPHGLPPELIDHPRYRVLRLLGSGGMGAVYQAEHRVMERLVALKVIRADLTADAAAVDRFHREVKAAGALAHPNIVTAFDADQIGNVHFLVMEYVEGIDLARHVAQRGPLPVAEACSHVRQAALGLQHAFERGMIHRDIKPHNLMLTQPAGAGTVKILDFGLARLAGAPVNNAQTVSGMILGTIDFMAPEQADDARTVDIRADIYSLGCTLYYLLSGRVLFPNGTLLQKIVAIMERQPPSLSQYRNDLPPRLLNVIDRLLAKKPDDRYQTPADVADALTPFLDTGGPPPVLEEHVPVATLIEEVEPVPARKPGSATEDLSRSTRPASGWRQRSRWRWGLDVLITVLLLLGPLVLGLALPTANGQWPGLAAAFAFCSGGVGWLVYRRVKNGSWGWPAYMLAGVVGVSLFCCGPVAMTFHGAWNVFDSYSNTPHSTWVDLDRDWKPPPANASTDQLLPTHIGTYQRVTVDEFADVPLLAIKAKGRHAHYKDFWKMDLCVYHVSAGEMEGIYKQALEKLNAGSWDPTDRSAIGRNSVKGGPGQSLMVYEFHAFNLPNLTSDLPRGALWYKDGWLFVLQAENMVDPETMLLKYLER